jgi:DUF4097 and DUF4098 domain-containing protein YvlB
MLSRTTVSYALSGAIVLFATPASADFKLERRLTLAPGGSFTLTADVGSVVVTGDSPSGAMVTVTSSVDNLDERFDFAFDERPGAATVTVKRRGSWLKGIFEGFQGRVQLTIHVPRTTAVSVRTSGGSVQASALAGDVHVGSSGGGLTVLDVDGSVDADTSGGPIRIERVRGTVTANTSGGGITITDVQAVTRADTSGGGIEIAGVKGDVHAETSGGGVRVRNAGGRVEARSSGGSVTVAFAAGNNKGGLLSSSGGGVRAEIDPSVALSIDASASGGSVNSNVPITVRGRVSNDSLSGDLNGGGPALRLRSSGGGVDISATPKTSAAR